MFAAEILHLKIFYSAWNFCYDKNSKEKSRWFLKYNTKNKFKKFKRFEYWKLTHKKVFLPRNNLPDLTIYYNFTFSILVTYNRISYHFLNTALIFIRRRSKRSIKSDITRIKWMLKTLWLIDNTPCLWFKDIL